MATMFAFLVILTAALLRVGLPDDSHDVTLKPPTFRGGTLGKNVSTLHRIYSAKPPPPWHGPAPDVADDVADASRDRLRVGPRRGLRVFPGMQLFYSRAGETAPRQQSLPLPPSSVESVLLTSESNVGDTGVLLPLVLSFYKTHDPKTNAVVLLSTASTAAKRAEWTAWGARHGVVVGFVKSPHERVVIGRFFCYLAYVRRLLSDRPGVTRVAMVDATDVLFQDMFMRRIPRDAVAYVAEPEHMRIGACNVHRGWIEGCQKYGKVVFDRVKEKPRICAGTVAGGTAAVEVFLRRFTGEMERTDYCNDQGVLNVMVHTGGLGQLDVDGSGSGVLRAGRGGEELRMTVWRHEDGPIMSLNTARREQDEARVLGVPVLHFGHSNAWASSYLAARGEELRREWIAKVGAIKGPPISLFASAAASSAAAATAEATPPPFSVAFYVQAAAGDPGVAVDALKSIRRFYPHAPVMLVSAPGEDYTVLCRYYVCVAEAWREDESGGDSGELEAASRSGGASVHTVKSLRDGAAGTAVAGSTIRVSGDAGSWGEEAAAASKLSGPPEICGSGRAKQFVATIRAVARWAATVEHDAPDDAKDTDNSGTLERAARTSPGSVIKRRRGVEWLVLMDPGTRLLAPVTRIPTVDANGADDQHWTRALNPKLLEKAAEVSGTMPAYHHSGLCGGAALRVSSLVNGRALRLDALKPLDDRVDWWHDVALATYFAFNGGAVAPWPDLRENGHPAAAHGPTAFERVGARYARHAGRAQGGGGAIALEGSDRLLFRRVNPEKHLGYVPPRDAVYDASAAAEIAEDAEEDGAASALAAEEVDPVRFASGAEALPWETQGGSIWGGNSRGGMDKAAGGALAWLLGMEAFRVRLPPSAPSPPPSSPPQTVVPYEVKGRERAAIDVDDVLTEGSHDETPVTMGYFLIALGPKYVEEAARLVRTIRKAGKDTKPVAVLVLPSDVELATGTNVFHLVIPYQVGRHASDGMDSATLTVGRCESRLLQPNSESTYRISSSLNSFNYIFMNFKRRVHYSKEHERYNILPRLRATDYAPYTEFIMLDTDILCSGPTDGVWASFQRSGQAISAPGLVTDCKWHFGTICAVSSKLGLTSQLPHVHAGAVYVNMRLGQSAKTELKKFRADTVYAFKNYDALGFKRWFRQKSRVLEILYSYAFSRAGYAPLDFYEHLIINFNIKATEALPSGLQRIGGYEPRRAPGGGVYPFTHYFIKAGFGGDYTQHYKALTQSGGG